MRHAATLSRLLIVGSALSPSLALGAPQPTPPPSGMAAVASATSAPAKALGAKAKKVVGTLVNAIRYDKRPVGEAQLGWATMAEHLLGPAYAQMGSAERSQFVEDFRVLLVGTAFPKGHDLFAYLDGVLYGSVREQNGRVTLPSTIVVHRNYKKTEMKVDWVLATEGDGLKVVDVVSMNDSTCDGVRDEEVAPLLKEGGVAKLLGVLHERAQATRKGAPK